MQREAAPPKSIIVTGAARGGTSMIASIVAHLGIWMGKGGPRYENPQLQRAVILNRWDVVETLVAEIESSLPVWGWKLPELAKHLDKLPGLLPNARYVFIKKKPEEIAKRRAGEDTGPRYEKMLRRVSDIYGKMDDFADRRAGPVLMLHYDDVVGDVSGTAARIADFCDVPPPAGDIAKAVAQDGGLYKSYVYVRGAQDRLGDRLEALATRHGVTLSAAQAYLAKSAE